MAAADEEDTYTLPSLEMMAYRACNRNQRKWYNALPGTSVDFKVCCESILKVIELNSSRRRFRPDGHRSSMFRKVYPDRRGRLIDNISEMAAFHGHINCMKLGRAIGVEWHTPDVWQKSACDEAAEQGHLECLVFAHNNGSPMSTWTCYFAAASGHLHCLKYLRENDCPWDDFTCTNAARYGHMDCLVYARQNGCPWDVHTCSLAALHGQLESLKYCRENGCPWDAITCEFSACSGNLDCLKYARSNGCPWTERTCRVAALNGQLDCLRYAHQNGCRWNVDEFLALNNIGCPADLRGGMENEACLRYAVQVKYGVPRKRGRPRLARPMK